MGRLGTDYPLLSLLRAEGLLLWKAARVLRQHCCAVRFRSTVPDICTFLRMLHTRLAQWLEMPQLSPDDTSVHLCIQGLQGWLPDRNIPVREGSASDALKRP